MRKSGRLVVVLAVSALVATGGVAAAGAAGAKIASSCIGSSDVSTETTPSLCQMDSVVVPAPTAITVVAILKAWDGSGQQVVQVQLTGGCVSNAKGADYTPISWPANPAPRTPPLSLNGSDTMTVPLPYPDPYSCTISLTAAVQAPLPGGTSGTYTDYTDGAIELYLDYTPAASAASVPLVKGYDDKCLDDKGNSSANRTKVVIWTCDSADPAQAWKYTSGELVHAGQCANDQGNGASGTKVILWTCNGSSDEKWSHTGSDGEFVLGSTAHGQLCLTDPDHSKTNRTQLIVYPCQNTSNQDWST